MLIAMFLCGFANTRGLRVPPRTTGGVVGVLDSGIRDLAASSPWL